jgi:dihydrofolate synthase/folylpolyglutamate synthase
MIPENRVVSFTASMIPVIESISPSFFELTVGMAFQYFAEENVEIAIIETGLGGRLDSTNIITPELSIITNIGFDHVALLGNTLPQIAYEKAGIIKEGIPTLIGEKSMETEPVFRLKAQNMQSDLYFADDMVTMKAAEQEIDRLVVDLTDNTLGKTLRLQTDLAGLYQKENIKTVYGLSSQARATIVKIDRANNKLWVKMSTDVVFSGGETLIFESFAGDQTYGSLATSSSGIL